MACFLGIDAGGTKTRFLLVDANAEAGAGRTGHHLFPASGAGRRCQCAGSRWRRTGLDPCRGGRQRHQLAFLDSRVWRECGYRQPAGLPACILGHARYHCDNDMICGWAGSLACADGINLIAGTGSMGYGQRPAMAHAPMAGAICWAMKAAPTGSPCAV